MSMDLLATLSKDASSDSGSAGSRREESSGQWDTILVVATVALVAFGLVMQYSASAVNAQEKYGNHLHPLWAQLPKIGVASLAMVALANIHYKWFHRGVYPLVLLALGSLLLVFVPGLGIERKGATRWIGLMVFDFQPAEFVKIVWVIYLAYSVGKKGEKMKQFLIAFVPHLVVFAILALLLLSQPDMGSTVILAATMGIMLFVSGAKFLYLGIFAGLGAGGFYAAVVSSQYRTDRILAYLDPWAYRETIGYQITESLIAIGTGGWTGQGLGAGHSKLGYVPELWNDFVAAIVAEELGLLGIIVVVGLFITLIWRGYRIAWRAEDVFGTYLAFGLTTLIGMQACANLFVVTGLAPTKGLTLPLMSQGGSSLLMTMASIGILLNISKRQPDWWEETAPQRAERAKQRRMKKKKRRYEKRKREKDQWVG